MDKVKRQDSLQEKLTDLEKEMIKRAWEEWYKNPPSEIPVFNKRKE